MISTFCIEFNKSAYRVRRILTGKYEGRDLQKRQRKLEALLWVGEGISCVGHGKARSLGCKKEWDKTKLGGQAGGICEGLQLQPWRLDIVLEEVEALLEYLWTQTELRCLPSTTKFAPPLPQPCSLNTTSRQLCPPQPESWVIFSFPFSAFNWSPCLIASMV